jgi:hypothetical protein
MEAKERSLLECQEGDESLGTQRNIDVQTTMGQFEAVEQCEPDRPGIIVRSVRLSIVGMLS